MDQSEALEGRFNMNKKKKTQNKIKKNVTTYVLLSSEVAPLYLSSTFTLR